MKNKEKTLGLSLVLHLLLSLIESAVTLLLKAVLKSSISAKIFSLVFTPVRYLLPVFLYRKASGYTPFVTPISSPCEIKFKPKSFKTALLYVFALSLTTVTLNVVGALTDAVLSLYGHNAETSLTVSAFDTVYIFLKSVFLAGILEEILFRGVLLHAFYERKRGTKILLSALIFALMHCNIYQFFYAFAAGAVIAAFAAFTGSLMFSVSVHFGANLFTFIFSVLNESLTYEAYIAAAHVSLVILAVVCLLSAVAYHLMYGEKTYTPSNLQAKKKIPKEIWIYIGAAALVTVINLL